MAAGDVDIIFPFGGLSKATGFQNQPPYTSPDVRNVRPREALTGRQRGCSRPGLRKAYTTRIGSSGYKIRLVNTVIPLTTALGGTYTEDFQDVPSSSDVTGRGWVHGSWVSPFGSYIAYAYAGYGSSTEGYLQASPAPASSTPGTDEIAIHRALPSDFNSSGNWGITSYVRSAPSDPQGAGVARFKMFYLMDNSAPNPTTGGTTFTVSYGINVAQNTFAWTASCAGVGTPSPTSGTVSSGVGPLGSSWGFAANYDVAAGTLKIYFGGTLLTTISGVGAPTGQRWGLGIYRDTSVSGAGLLYGFGVDKVIFSYTPVTTGLVRSSRLVASADGRLYYEDGSAEMVYLSSANPTITDDYLVQSSERAGKLYIADHGDIRKTGSSSGTTSGGGAPRTFDDAGVADWTALGIDADDDVLYISGGTNVTVGNYRITSLAAGQVTLTDDPGASGSSISYQIRRAPKIFDYDAATLTIWHQSTISTKGFVPLGCPLIARFQDCMVLAGEPSNTHLWYMSRQGDPTDWLYGAYAGDIQAAMAGSTSESGVMSDQMTALVPYMLDYLLFGYRTSLWVLRGHPRQGGRIDNVSRTIGVLDRGAWCHGPNGEVIFISRAGLHVLSGMSLTDISANSIPVELINIDTSSVTVLMEYDNRDRGVHIYLTNATAATPTTHYWMDWDTKTIWPVQLYDDHRPFSIGSHFLTRTGEKTVILGGSDGYLRYFDRSAGDDDTQTISSHAWIGPIKLGRAGRTEGILQEIDGVLSDDSGSVTWEAYVGDTPEEAKAASALYSGTWTAGSNYRDHPRTRGSALFIKLSSVSGSRWALEAATVKIADAGIFRKP